MQWMLQALKIMIVGPPASGKTTVAKKLANHYRLHYLHVKEVLALAIENMVRLNELVIYDFWWCKYHICNYITYILEWGYFILYYYYFT